MSGEQLSLDAATERARAEAAAEVFQQHREELGFVNRAQCREKDLYTVSRDGRVVGALLGNHCVRKPQSTIYELAVLPEHRGKEIGSELVEGMATDSEHDKLIAKCPRDLPSNHFYRETGWELIGFDEGKNRGLCVWKLSI